MKFFKNNSNVKNIIVIFSVIFFFGSEPFIVKGVLPTASVVRVNQDKTVSVDGFKIFPMVMYYLCSGGMSSSQCRDNLNANNMYIDMLGEYPAYISDHTATNSKFILLDNAGTSYKDNSGLFGYITHDEPISNNILAREQTHYNNLHASDPNHIVISIDWLDLYKLEPMSDVIVSDLYPIKRWMLDSGIPRANTVYFNDYQTKNTAFATRKDADDYTKPVWQVISSLSAIDGGGVHPLTPTELRAFTYQAITQNMKGLMFYLYDKNWSPKPNEGLNQDMALAKAYAYQAEEIKSLNNILVLPTIDYKWEYSRPGTGTNVSFGSSLTASGIFVNGMKNWNWMLKQDGDIWYLFVLNKDSRSIVTDITIQGLTGTMVAETLGNINAGSNPGRILTLSNGKFTDSFNGLAAHIYKISAAASVSNSADLNSDNIVDFFDFDILLSHWNSVSRPKADLNQDGAVNSVDFGILMSQWG